MNQVELLMALERLLPGVAGKMFIHTDSVTDEHTLGWRDPHPQPTVAKIEAEWERIKPT